MIENSSLGLEAKRRAEWIAETQMFQRIAGIGIATDETLGTAWDAMKPKERKFNVENIRTHRIIQDAAVRAGTGRRS